MYIIHIIHIKNYAFIFAYECINHCSRTQKKLRTVLAGTEEKRMAVWNRNKKPFPIHSLTLGIELVNVLPI